jgi:hypothetical protein
MGKGSATMHGYSKVFSAYRLDRVEREDTRQYITQLLGKGSNKFYLDDYSVKNLQDRDKPTQIDYTFRIGDYFQKIGNEIYVNLNLNKDHYNHNILPSRETPWENEYKYIKSEVSILEIPEGYEIDYLPSNMKCDGKSVGIEVAYAVQAGKITMHKKFYIDFLLMTPDQFGEWNESIKKISEVYKEAIILKKK